MALGKGLENVEAGKKKKKYVLVCSTTNLKLWLTHFFFNDFYNMNKYISDLAPCSKASTKIKLDVVSSTAHGDNSLVMFSKSLEQTTLAQ